MSSSQVERTFFVANHPTDHELYLPVFGFLHDHPKTALVAGNIWKLFPLMDVIPVDKSTYYSSQSFKHLIARTVLSLFGKNIPQIDVSEAMVKRIREDKNVLIFPSGEMPNGNIDGRWKNGISRALLHAASLRPQISFVHFNGWNVEMTPPEPASNYLHSANAIEVTKRLWEAHQGFFPHSRE